MLMIKWAIIMAQSVDLPSISFKSKSEATSYFKDMLNRYRDGEILTPEDDAILFELLQRHPEADDKIGVGVKIFYRERSPIHPTSCFHLERHDGITTDFSYISCIRGFTSSLAQQFYEACRYSVSDKLTRQKAKLFKEAGGTMKCSKTGLHIAIKEANYCHTEPKFRDIVIGFILENKVIVHTSMIASGSDMQYVVKFADSKIENLFRDYHENKANMAIFKKYHTGY